MISHSLLLPFANVAVLVGSQLQIRPVCQAHQRVPLRSVTRAKIDQYFQARSMQAHTLLPGDCNACPATASQHLARMAQCCFRLNRFPTISAMWRSTPARLLLFTRLEPCCGLGTAVPCQSRRRFCPAFSHADGCAGDLGGLKEDAPLLLANCSHGTPH